MSYATASPGTLYVSATDLQRGVAAMTYSVDGKRAPTRLGRTLSLRLDPSVPHTVRAFAVDRAGNVSRRLNLTTVASLRTVRTTTIDRIPEGWVEGAHN
jgi:hypothetical protein